MVSKKLKQRLERKRKLKEFKNSAQGIDEVRDHLDLKNILKIAYNVFQILHAC